MSPNLRFIWDPHKAVANQRKHKITFDEAREVFNDHHARISLIPIMRRTKIDGISQGVRISERRAEGHEIKECEDGF